MGKSHQNQKLKPGQIMLYGKHAVKAALLNKERKLINFYASKDTQNEFSNIKDKIVLERKELDDLTGFGAVHQGVAAVFSTLPHKNFKTFLQKIETKTKSIIVMLDQVTDPHNIGAVLRSSLAFQADAVIMQDRNSPGETPTLAKSAAGALEKMPIINVTNLNRTAKDLKKDGYWTIALTGYTDTFLDEIDMPNKIVLILGSEGKGIRELILKNADFKAKIKMSNQIESLNISNAAAVSLYETAKKLSLV
jgi:23S rRNA (guanosine2251-2'-O)-methyltransferase